VPEVHQEAFRSRNKFLTLPNKVDVAETRSVAGQIEPDSLISHRLPLKDLLGAPAWIESRDPTVKKGIVQPNGQARPSSFRGEIDHILFFSPIGFIL